jgi:hypothetical protein
MDPPSSSDEFPSLDRLDPPAPDRSQPAVLIIDAAAYVR